MLRPTRKVTMQASANSMKSTTPGQGLPYGHKQQPGTAQGSVTAVHFMPYTDLLATATDASATVKLWDVRNLNSPLTDLAASLPASQQPPHLNAVAMPATLSAGKSKGVVCIKSDPQGVQLQKQPAQAYASRWSVQ
jgi:WD40 repeat protein